MSRERGRNAPRSGAGRPPHIVVILSDQLRADCVCCYGNPIIQTPHVDALAAAGTRFARAFSQHPQCVPSRASILTSRYPHVNGSTSNYVAVGDHELTLPEYLRACGYRTAGTGKLHLPDGQARGRLRRADPERRTALRRHRPGGAAPRTTRRG